MEQLKLTTIKLKIPFVHLPLEGKTTCSLVHTKEPKELPCFIPFFGTCKKHEVNPYEWLKATLENIADAKMSELDNYLPHNFQKS